jgi:hypothetical protein
MAIDLLHMKVDRDGNVVAGQKAGQCGLSSHARIGVDGDIRRTGRLVLPRHPVTYSLLSRGMPVSSQSRVESRRIRPTSKRNRT